MSVNIGEIITTVTLEPEQAEQSPGNQEQWQLAANTRSLLGRLRVDYVRTTAEDFDD